MIIGLVGFIGSGKNTAGNILVEKYNYNRTSFAESLKELTCNVFGWDIELLRGETENSRIWRETPDIWWENELNWNYHAGSKLSKRFTPRFAMQYIGTNVFRKHFDSNIWCLSLKKRIQHIDNVVITDTRFANEIDLIKQMNGKIVRIIKGPEPVWYETAKNANLTQNFDIMNNKYPNVHVSEWAWIGSDIDYVLDNNGSHDDLYNAVNTMVQSIT